MTFEALKQTILDLTGIAEEDFDPDGDLLDFGLDSIQVITLLGDWQDQGIKIDLASLAKERTLNAWWRLLEPQFETQS